jgi:aspartate 1-decarboxylase
VQRVDGLGDLVVAKGKEAPMSVSHTLTAPAGTRAFGSPCTVYTALQRLVRNGGSARRRMLLSKIHRAVVTDANLHYVGSISIDRDLMDAAGILEFEQVTVLDIDNGARFETYVIAGGSGEICLNGVAARLVTIGDHVILLTYADFDDAELVNYQTRHVNHRNALIAP